MKEDLKKEDTKEDIDKDTLEKINNEVAEIIKALDEEIKKFLKETVG